MKNIKKKNIKQMLVPIGILLITIGLFLQNNIEFINSFMNNNLNLNLSEIDTLYENSDSYDLISYVDTSWAWPTDNDFYLTSTYSNYHPAIDIVSRNDRNIYSAYNGEVITNSYKFDNGNYLVIKQDNGYYIMYAHLSQKLVTQGQRVEKGQLIGVMGSTGFATGVHLHFAVWEGYPHRSKSVNPLSFY